MASFSIYRTVRIKCGQLDGPVASALRRAIAEVKQCWSVIEWVTKNVLSRAFPCFGRHDMTLVILLAVFAVVSTPKPHWGHVVGYGPFSLWVTH
jgi:hypothetical protein